MLRLASLARRCLRKEKKEEVEEEEAWFLGLENRIAEFARLKDTRIG